MSHLFAGATVVLGGRFDPEQLAAQIRQTGATRTSLVPTQLVRWLDHLRGRDPRLERLQADLCRRLPHSADRCSSGRLALHRPADRRALRHDGSAGDLLSAAAQSRCGRATGGSASWSRSGRALSGYQVRIAADVARRKAPGEVLIRGGNVMAGYWQQEAATPDGACATAGCIPATSANSTTPAISTSSAA